MPRPHLLCVTLLLFGCNSEAEDLGPWLRSAPLPERTAHDGPRFHRVPAASSGLAFTNELRPENTIAYVYSGAGVAVGDYDGDGRQDVYLVSQDGRNRLFRQVAPLRFADVTESAGGLGGGDAWGTAAAFADVDGDGDLDLYVAGLESGNLLYENLGNGTFRENARERGLDFQGACMGVAFADYDRDGDLDVYLLNNRVFGVLLPAEIVAEVRLPKDVKKTLAQLYPPYPEFPTVAGKLTVPAGYEDWYAIQSNRVVPAGQPDRLLRNDGKGRFRDVTATAGLADHANGLGVVWWDADGDGWPDLYVANDFNSPDLFYRNRGDGTFEEISRQALPHTAFFGMGCDFGDIDNDGRLDLCVADMSSTSHYMGKMLMGNMDTHRWFLQSAEPRQYMRNALYVNTGTGRFLEAAYLANLASTDWTWSMLFGDLDEDGRLDCFATNGIPRFNDDPDVGRRFTELWQQGRKQQALDLYRHLRRIDERNALRRNLGDLRFADVAAAWGLDEPGVGHGAALADLDGDGDLDLIVNNQNAEVSLYENRTADSHRILVGLECADPGNRHGVGSTITLVADGVRQTRYVSPTRGFMSATAPVEHFGLGTSTRIESLTVRWPSGREQTFLDLAADQHLVLRETRRAPRAAAEPRAPVPFVAAPAQSVPNAPHREAEFDDFAVQPLLPHQLSREGPGLATADLDGDGRTTVWVGGAAGQAGGLWQRASNGTWQRLRGPWDDHADREDLGAVFLDHDSDGDLDLYVVSGGVEAGERTELLRDRLYRNDGQNRFTDVTATALPDLRRSGSCVCAADFDGDGDLDLFVGSRVEPGRFPHAPASVLLRNDGGRFTDQSATLPAGGNFGMVTAATWADLDGDGRPELLVAAAWQPLRVCSPRAGSSFEDRTTELGFAGHHGQWHGLVAADFDGDGQLEIVATNLGLNTKYKASPDHPLTLYARDFDGNGTFDVVEAKHQGKELLPVRGLSCSSSAIPALAKKFPTYDAFARATLGQIYGAAELEQCLQLTCHELRHLLWRRSPDGRYTATPLPTLAQISAGSGMAVGDWDGDGYLDLVLAQNSFAPEPETGRIDGGLSVLLRFGPDGFTAVPAAASGLVVPEDSKALATLDLDGDGALDLLFACNDGPLRGFVAQRPANVLTVVLAGPKGNPQGIGARVELTQPDGRRTWRHVAAGHGYLTHDAAVQFAGVAAGSHVTVHWPDGTQRSWPVPDGGGRLVAQR